MVLFVGEEEAIDKVWEMAEAIGMMWIQKQPSTQQVQAEAFVQAYFWDERIQLRKINNTVNIFSFFLFTFFLMLKIYHVYFQKSWVKNNHFGL